MIEALLRPYKKTLQVSMELASVVIIKKYVSAGIGIALLPEAFAQTEVAAGTLRLVPLKGHKLYRVLGLVYRRGSPMSMPAKAFLDILQGSVPTPEEALAPLAK